VPLHDTTDRSRLKMPGTSPPPLAPGGYTLERVKNRYGQLPLIPKLKKFSPYIANTRIQLDLLIFALEQLQDLEIWLHKNCMETG
jgi:hypothetical protein